MTKIVKHVEANTATTQAKLLTAGIRELPLTGEIAILAAELDGEGEQVLHVGGGVLADRG